MNMVVGGTKNVFSDNKISRAHGSAGVTLTQNQYRAMVRISTQMVKKLGCQFRLEKQGA